MTYRGSKAVLATMHGKEAVIAPALSRSPGLVVTVAPNLDTDVLGTFAGEVERPGGPSETAILKARMGIEATGVPIGIATEGSFGPDGTTGLLPGGLEVIAFVDEVAGIEIVEARRSVRTNLSSILLGPDEPPSDRFLEAAGFPTHALIVVPGGIDPARDGGEGIPMGITASDRLEVAIARGLEMSGDGTVRVETDMRAHVNPTRMEEIAALAEALGQRLTTPCPGCERPGFGRVASIPGLPCSACGEPTGWIATETWACQACRLAEDRPRSDGLKVADPARCPACNP